MLVPVLQIVGYSNSGKTTILSSVIELLVKEGYSVAAIKSARAHSFQKGNKDSDRFIRAGAGSVSVVFDNGVQMFVPRNMGVDLIIKILYVTSEPDIIFLEGFKRLEYDKILVWSDDIRKNLSRFNLINLKAIYLWNKEETIKNIPKRLINRGVPIISSVQELLEIVKKNYLGRKNG